MDHREQELAVFYVVGLVATVLLVGARFGLEVGLMTVLGALLLLYVCGKPVR